MASKQPTRVTDDRELLIERLLDAPPSLVYKVWTEPEHLIRWWGPKDFSTPSCDMKVKPGGRFRMLIRSGDGTDYWMRGEYREVVEAERLVFTFAWEDENGDPVHETLVTVKFEPEGKKTRFSFHQALFRTPVECEDHRGGWTECFDRLSEYVAMLPE
jgi:uncharacterized protein YndB with AHSA1/START domain